MHAIAVYYVQFNIESESIYSSPIASNHKRNLGMSDVKLAEGLRGG
jgi:hypothetical protein